jgi:hypothetical protein
VANAIFDDAREGFLAGEIDFDTAVIKCALIRSYTFSNSHKFVSDVTGAGGVLHATSAALGSKTVTDGTADAGDFTFTAPAANASAHSLLVFQSSAVGGGGDVAASSQRVIAYYDTGTGLTVVPNGADITVQWNASGLFKL